jgi:hypothetical protein
MHVAAGKQQYPEHLSGMLIFFVFRYFILRAFMVLIFALFGKVP